MSDSVTHYELTPKALTDLDAIWRYGAEGWSPEHADRYTDELVRVFELLVSMPTMARERTEFSPPVRIHVHGAHLVVYVVQANMVLIVRVLGGRQNWKAILERVDA